MMNQWCSWPYDDGLVESLCDAVVYEVILGGIMRGNTLRGFFADRSKAESNIIRVDAAGVVQRRRFSSPTEPSRVRVNGL